MRFLSALGPLRVMLATAAVGAVVFVTPPGMTPVYFGWPLVTTVLIPVLVPLVFMVLLLDTMMSAIFMIDKQRVARRRYQLIMGVNLTMGVLMLLRWLPYYRSISE
jgi:hypothetical protein